MAKNQVSQRPTRPRLTKVDGAIGVVRQEAVVLLVDDDRVTQRFVELTLGKAQTNALDFTVEATNAATGAFEILSNTMVDVIVAETTLSDMSGLRFLRRLKQERRLRDIPFVFLSSDKREETRILAVKCGADSYLIKPSSPAELTTYAAALVARRRAVLEERGRRAYRLAGELGALPFPDLVSILQQSRKCGVLSVVTPRAAGEVYFGEAEMLHATFGSLQGEQAFYQLMSAAAGTFEFALRHVDTFPERTITASVTALVMEGARLMDEEAHGRQQSSSEDTLPPPASLGVSVKQRAALVPSKELGLAFERGIADPFVMGELRLISLPELNQLMEASSRADHLVVHLVADLNDGVSTLLAVAAQSTENLIVSALRREPKLLALTFHMRHERSLTVVLIDAEEIGTVVRELEGSPGVTVVAPPQGDFLALGAKGMVELGRLFDGAPPTVVVGVGNGALEENLGEVAQVRNGRIPIRCVVGALSAANTDLRTILAAGVAFWATANRAPVSRVVKGGT
jgi:CheY-like chemotaxis protein